MIHHQYNGLAHAPLSGPERIRIAVVFTLSGKLIGPLFFQLLGIDHLIPFQPGTLHIGAVGHALKMDHLGKRLIYYPVTGFPHFKGQIRVLAVSGGKAGIKTADLLPQSVGKKNGCAGNIVYIFYIVVLRLIRIVQPSVVPPGTVAPDDAPRLLQAAIRIHQLGTNHANSSI